MGYKKAKYIGLIFLLVLFRAVLIFFIYPKLSFLLILFNSIIVITFHVFAIIINNNAINIVSIIKTIIILIIIYVIIIVII